MTWLTGLRMPFLISVYLMMVRLQAVLTDELSMLQVKTPYNTIIMNQNSMYFTHNKGEAQIFFGLTLPDGLNPRECQEGNGCLNFGVAKVVVTEDEHCQKVTWTSSKLEQLKDCIALDGHWYGGGEQIRQPWPIEKVPRQETAFVTSDMLQNREQWYGGISEAYWISSRGIAVKVEDDTPLFLSLPDEDGDGNADKLCLNARYKLPFSNKEGRALSLSYFVCSCENVREVHERTFPKFFAFPNGIPDVRMIEDPIWSTWAEYKTNVNESNVWDFAISIKNRGFRNSQVEIDDNWETCYGDAIFSPDRFPDPKRLVDKLHREGFRVTLWIHPFVNGNCEAFSLAYQRGYFIKDSNNVTQLTSWWQGSNAGLIDFTNPSAVDWWTRRLQNLKDFIGIDSFKFDAGETSYMPTIYSLQQAENSWPDIYSKLYVEAISPFGGMIETRVGKGTQNHPIFVRMLDKDSVWEDNNGLRTLIPSLLHFGIIGYPFVLPDMIGGNSYLQEPNEELFLRWAQANTFMPSLQFSILPWKYGDAMTERCKKVTSLHSEFTPLILRLAHESARTGAPIIRPTWWLCPEEEVCLAADQQFLLGDELLVTPVMHEGARSLNVVIPPGSWRRADSGHFYSGPSTVTLEEITLDSLVYFTKVIKKEL